MRALSTPEDADDRELGDDEIMPELGEDSSRAAAKISADAMTRLSEDV